MFDAARDGVLLERKLEILSGFCSLSTLASSGNLFVFVHCSHTKEAEKKMMGRPLIKPVEDVP